jgi:RNA polymerase subunit RPABC4/transcription elongation factor Spt4
LTVDRLVSTPWFHGVLSLRRRQSTLGRQLVLLGLAVLAIALALPMGSMAPGHPTTPGQAAPSAPLALIHHDLPRVATQGDLVVNASNSPYIISGSPTGVGTFVEAGNVTVLAGGTLELRNVTFVLQQYIGDTGTMAERLSHLYTIADQGTIVLNHSTITSNVGPFNPYSKVYLNVSSGGQLRLNGSGLLFPGWISVYGAGSALELSNQSVIGPNPRQETVSGENQTIGNDSRWAPTLVAAAGAHVTLLNSSYAGTYRDNVSQFGMPGPAIPIADQTTHDLTGTTGSTWTNFALASADTENLTRAVLYRTIASATVTINYESAVNATSSVDALHFGGVYAFGPVSLASGGGSVTVPLPAGAITAINAATFPAFLVSICGGGAYIALGSLNLSATITVDSVSLNVSVALDYNMTIEGAGTVLTAIDSSLQLNWNLTPGTPVNAGRLPPSPWGSNKLLLLDGATGFFANLTIPSALPFAYWNQSAILPDATSTAVFYRWLDVTVLGAGAAPAAGAELTAFYSFDPNQQNNLTATALNQLSSASPALWAYVQHWDAVHQIPGYGVTGVTGEGFLLLASTVLTESTLPEGSFLGAYHVAASLAGVPNGTQWLSASVTPYPSAMDPAGVDQPIHPIVFANYAPSLSVPSSLVLADGIVVANDTVAIGQNLTVQIDVVNSGIGPVTTFSADLEYGQQLPLAPIQVVALQNFGALATGDSKLVNLTWTVSENITGRLGTIHALFYSIVTWNQGVAPDGGSVPATVPVTIVPAYIGLTYSPPTIDLVQGQDVASTGTIQYVGNETATINVTAVGHGGRYFVGQAISKPGSFQLFVTPLFNMTAGTYDLNVSGFYNDRTVYVELPGALTVASTATTAPVPFLQQTFLGLPIWVWIAIIAIAAAGILIALWFLRSQAKGKLVECGECGELIPEAATICPKCGAEFESDLVRCSRCGSTIPSSSAQCPECAAQLLGPEVADPERQGYGDFVEKFRVEAKKELGENYGEGAFWDWYKRQGSFVSFNQWKLQQSQGSRAGMAAPPGSATEPVDLTAQFQSPPPRGGSGGASAPTDTTGAKAGAAATPAPAGGAPPPSGKNAAAPAATPTGGSAAMKACSNCGKEIPPDYLVCPFCGAVTR